MKKRLLSAAGICTLAAIYSLENNYQALGLSFVVLSIIFLIINEAKSRQHEKEV